MSDNTGDPEYVASQIFTKPPGSPHSIFLGLDESSFEDLQPFSVTINFLKRYLHMLLICLQPI